MHTHACGIGLSRTYRVTEPCIRSSVRKGSCPCGLFFSVRSQSKPRGFSNVLTVLLESVAKSSHQWVAVVLSGVDADGAAALRAFRQHGGIVIAQEPDSAERPGMPRPSTLASSTMSCHPDRFLAGSKRSPGNSAVFPDRPTDTGAQLF